MLGHYYSAAVAQLRRQFEQAYPAVDFKQSQADQATLLQQVHDAQIDLALTYDLQIPKTIHFEPLAELPPYVIL